MTDGALHPATVQLWLAALTVLTLAALGIACAVVWRLNRRDNQAEASPPPAPVVSPPPPRIPQPPPKPTPTPKPARVDPPTSPTIPIADAIDDQLTRFNIPGRTRT